MEEHDEPGMGDEDLEHPIPLVLGDTLDLHTFLPREVPAVVTDYLEAVIALGLTEILIIHGRGSGVQRRAVRELLAKHPRVADFGDVPERAGGATWVRVSATPATATAP